MIESRVSDTLRYEAHFYEGQAARYQQFALSLDSRGHYQRARASYRYAQECEHTRIALLRRAAELDGQIDR